MDNLSTKNRFSTNKKWLISKNDRLFAKLCAQVIHCPIVENSAAYNHCNFNVFRFYQNLIPKSYPQIYPLIHNLYTALYFQKKHLPLTHSTYKSSKYLRLGYTSLSIICISILFFPLLSFSIPKYPSTPSATACAILR